MKKSLKATIRLIKAMALLGFALLIGLILMRWLSPIYAVSLGGLAIAISIVFIAVLSKAYKRWPV